MQKPTGFNDNNFFRKNIQSNINNSGYQQPIIDYGNINKSFTENKTVLDFRNTSNTGGFRHNNIGKNLLAQNITEFKVHIDSKDRELKYYNDPYDFVVTFGNGTFETENGGNKKYNNPIINHKFSRVKYIRLETAILPKYSGVVSLNNTYVSDPETQLTNDRFIGLNINELTDEILSTSSDKPFALIIPDTSLGASYYVGTPIYGTKVFKSSSLGNITKLSISLTDSFGNKIVMNNKYTYNDSLINSQNDIRHPLNKKFQIYLTFTIGVLDCNIDKQPDYLN